MPTPVASKIPTILQRLRRDRPAARYELDWTTPLDLLVATILAAQCTDERVNRVTATLFKKYPDARAYAEADTAVLEEDIRPTGFYRNKAKAIQGACRALVARFGGEVPRAMDELVTLPGVARKTANVVLNTAWDIPSGVIVDTHVARVSKRLGLSREEEPDRIEVDLMRDVPQADWTFFGPAMVLHGRYVCKAQGPACGSCALAEVCDKRLEPGVTPSDGEAPAPPKPKKEADVKDTKNKAKRAPQADAGGGLPPLPPSWRAVLADETRKPYFQDLARFVVEERKSHTVFPPQHEVFAALELTPYQDVRVVLLGQDPYHDDDQAQGLCFSVRPPVPPPPSLLNMFKELQGDVGFRIPNNGSLVPWAKQGMLLLNAVLTVRAHSPNSHKNHGWETFTDAVLSKVSERAAPAVFVLWGAYAQKKEKLIDTSRHVVLKAAHPSPLSARSGFFGSKPFSSINDALRHVGKPPIDWQLPDV